MKCLSGDIAVGTMSQPATRTFLEDRARAVVIDTGQTERKTGHIACSGVVALEKYLGAGQLEDRSERIVFPAFAEMKDALADCL